VRCGIAEWGLDSLLVAKPEALVRLRQLAILDWAETCTLPSSPSKHQLSKACLGPRLGIACDVSWWFRVAGGVADVAR
jgi:hypothetical protein